MAWVATGVAAVSVVSSIFGANAEAKQKQKAIKAKRRGAKLQYNSLEDSTNIMKGVNREQSANAIAETARAGAENLRQTQGKIDQAASTTASKSEGLTSGRSAGRQMVSVYIQGNKMLQEADNKTTSQITQITEAQDKATNDMNNKLLQAHQEMAAVLADTGASINKTNAVISSGISGFAAGSALNGAFSSSSAGVAWDDNSWADQINFDT